MKTVTEIKTQNRVLKKTIQEEKAMNRNKSRALGELKDNNYREKMRVKRLLNVLEQGKLDENSLHDSLTQLYTNLSDNEQLFTAYMML